MPTIKDIAKAAGVSHGTVSNVLNNKGNVSAKKIELVERTALEMGYNINRSAKQLRQGISNHVDILIPDNEIGRYRDLYKTLSKYAEEGGYSYNLHISEGVPHKEKGIVRRLLSNKAHTIVIISCLNNIDEFYSDLHFSDTNFIFVERKVLTGENKSFFYSYDSEKIGENIASYIKEKKYKNIIYFSNRKIYSFENDIFKLLLVHFDNPGYSIRQYSSDTGLNILTGFNILFSKMKCDVIVTTSKEKAGILKDIIELSNLDKEIEIITLSSSDILQFSDFTEYELDYKSLGKVIGRNIARDRDFKGYILDPPKLSLPKNRKIYRESKVNIACTQGVSDDALKYVSGLIHSSTGIKAEIKSYKYSTLFKMIKEGRVEENIDLIRVDMAWLSTFAEEIFLPLDSVNYNFDGIFNSFIEGIEKEYTLFRGRRYAFPIDPSILLLFYRKDLFEDARNARMYYEEYRTPLGPPENFKEYIRIASFFTRTNNENAGTEFGTTCTINSPQSIACQFLPIYYSLGGEISGDDPPFLDYGLLKKAIEINLEAMRYSRVSEEAFWGDSVRQFASGEAAMSITFSNRTSNVINSKVSNVLGKFDFETLPGEKQIIGGGVLGINKQSKNIKTVCTYLENLYSERISIIFACLCGASSSKYVYRNEDIADIYPWMKFVQKNLKNGKRRFRIKEFNELDFEYNLGSSLMALFKNKCTIDECIYKIQTINSNF